ncbi:hypothetical protein FDN13_05075 [Caloramator sp. E03]|nr:hypothetical protein FDN13_05075 [Caloramator sp. E03]
MQIWHSSNKSVVSVNQDGKVVALKKGTATIAVKTSDGKYTAKCIVNVR